MHNAEELSGWTETIRQRYRNYLRTSFFFKEPALRTSFAVALEQEAELLKGPFPEPGRLFARGVSAPELAQEYLGSECDGLRPALLDNPLYTHQERAVRMTFGEARNVVVATGTASGKTESFLYPILFELYRQHLAGQLAVPGVRALVLYPMNALANDQRERLRKICRTLEHHGSDFIPTFGQYIGETPYIAPADVAEEAARGELLGREQMRQTPPHILLTNYSMLEYLLMRPDDSPLFENSSQWQFMVLDEAHQYRGAKGMEMGMLLRRLKQRLRDGGRADAFRCIATSATMSSGEGGKERQAVADFATALFGEPFEMDGVIFGELDATDRPMATAGRYHAFLRALEGAFLVHRGGRDVVVLNRSGGEAPAGPPVPLEIALCRECGQHYYVGRERGGRLAEGIRDPSHESFGVEYFLPTDYAATHWLCRRCGALSGGGPTCDCDAGTGVKHCEAHPDRPDQLRECAVCGYQRGSLGDPVQEIVHGSDGPNAVIATALHEVLPAERRKVLAFADSRQEAAFFAWYAEDSYKKLRDRNLMLRALRSSPIDVEGLSVDDLATRLARQWDAAGLLKESDTQETRKRAVLGSIFAEALTEERRLSLAGVGLVKWTVRIPADVLLPAIVHATPWRLSDFEARELIGFLLEQMRTRRALALPEGPGAPDWADVTPWATQAFAPGPPGRRKGVVQWGGPQSAVVTHYLARLLGAEVFEEQRPQTSQALMRALWQALRDRDRAHRSDEQLLWGGQGRWNGTFRISPHWLRVQLADAADIWECDTCAGLSAHRVRGICPRNGCPGTLGSVDEGRLGQNHYRILYESDELPAELVAEEHTAQIESGEARRRQRDFKDGSTHLLSSSTTFEVGVDLGDLDVVFLRNVPPEPFNYTQRVGRAGRRDRPGLALTYCRRNPHDLYHYGDPEERVIRGKVEPPRLRMTNERIIVRHMVAASLAAFFKADDNRGRFKNVEAFVGDWSAPRSVSDVRSFCTGNAALGKALRRIVPDEMHDAVGLSSDGWVRRVCGPASRFAQVEAEVVSDYQRMEDLRLALFQKRESTGRVEARIRTVRRESTLTFLSRKAVIPKYGFPVDVVELDTHSEDGRVALQRDLSQAIAEYAPGGRVVANKREWSSYGLKMVAGKAWPVRSYAYDDARSFRQWHEGDPSAPPDARRYVIPEWGFVTQWSKQPPRPQGRARRFYTTRPFFRGFGRVDRPTTRVVRGVEVTQAQPGTLVILCEGRNRSGFYICGMCGAHATARKRAHRTPANIACQGSMGWFSLGHELVTDVVRLKFPGVGDEWHAYSVGYAVLLGAAETLGVPNTDLNVTIARAEDPGTSAIVLYDAVPGGAGLVAQLERDDVFSRVLVLARQRVDGDCGCDSSCYGCLRSYRNQFAHPYLHRMRAAETLDALRGP